MIVLDYGSWPSPISAAMAGASGGNISQLRRDADALYWVETRPEEGGRQSLLELELGSRQIVELSPAPLNVRSRVHEYGGGAFAAHGDQIIFSNDADWQLYLRAGSAPAAPLTCAVQSRLRRLCVRIPAAGAGWQLSKNIPAARRRAISLPPSTPTRARRLTLCEGRDFYASPRLSADGKRLAWLAWDQPNMPWDGCELFVADLSVDGTLGPEQCVAGAAAESIFQPSWAPDGSLYFVSDRSGFWNLYRWRAGITVAVYPAKRDFGRAQWVFGLTTYACLSADLLACTFVQDGAMALRRTRYARRRLA